MTESEKIYTLLYQQVANSTTFTQIYKDLLFQQNAVIKNIFFALNGT